MSMTNFKSRSIFVVYLQHFLYTKKARVLFGNWITQCLSTRNRGKIVFFLVDYSLCTLHKTPVDRVFNSNITCRLLPWLVPIGFSITRRLDIGWLTPLSNLSRFRLFRRCLLASLSRPLTVRSFLFGPVCGLVSRLHAVYHFLKFLLKSIIVH